MNKVRSDKEYPQRCMFCDRIGYMEDVSLDVWTCRYCGKTNKYSPGSRFVSNGSLAYVECMCGRKIPINSKINRYVLCPQCGVKLHINNTKIEVTGNKASEVLDVLKGYVESINQRKDHKGINLNRNIDLRWERFAANAHDTCVEFEQLCKELFRLEYFDRNTVFDSVPNNPGVEIHPLRAYKGEFSGKVISFQSKYCTGSVDYSSIKHSAENTLKYYYKQGASEESIEAVILYCNRIISRSDKTGTYQANRTFIATENLLKEVGVILKVISGDELLTRICQYPELIERYFFV